MRFYIFHCQNISLIFILSATPWHIRHTVANIFAISICCCALFFRLRLSDQCSRSLWYSCWRPSATNCGPRWRCQSITDRTRRQLRFGEIQSETLVARALEKLADQGCQVAGDLLRLQQPEAGRAHNSRRRQRQQRTAAPDIQRRIGATHR